MRPLRLGFYEAFGFVHEGRRARQVKHRGEYDDHQMAYFVPSDSSATARRASKGNGDERIKD